MSDNPQWENITNGWLPVFTLKIDDLRCNIARCPASDKNVLLLVCLGGKAIVRNDNVTEIALSSEY